MAEPNLYTSTFQQAGQIEQPGYRFDEGLKTAQQLGMNQQRMEANAADLKNQKMQAMMQRSQIFSEKLDQISGLPEAQKAQAYNQMMPELVRQGIVTEDQGIPMQYDPRQVGVLMARNERSKEMLAKRAMEEDIAASKARRGVEWAKIAAAKDKEKDSNQNQYNAAKFALRGEQAEDILGQLEAQGFEASSFGTWAKKKLPEMFKPSDLKSYENAKRNYVSAILRKESGAAIGKEEYEEADKKYFPQEGDSPENMAQKAALRAQDLAALRAEGGRAYDKISRIQAPNISQNKQQSLVGKMAGALENSASAQPSGGSVPMVFPNGKRKMVPQNLVQQAIAAGGKAL